MEIAIIALGVMGLVFAGMALKRARPQVVAERVPGHPDTFEFWNEGPGRAVVVRADVVAASFPQGAAIAEAVAAIPGLWIDERILVDRGRWARGAILDPLRRFEARLPTATTLRIAYRGAGILGSVASASLVIEGSHRADPAEQTSDHH